MQAPDTPTRRDPEWPFGKPTPEMTEAFTVPLHERLSVPRDVRIEFHVDHYGRSHECYLAGPFKVRPSMPVPYLTFKNYDEEIDEDRESGSETSYAMDPRTHFYDHDELVRSLRSAVQGLIDDAFGNLWVAWNLAKIAEQHENTPIPKVPGTMYDRKDDGSIVGLDE